MLEKATHSKDVFFREARKRKREIFFILLISSVLVGLTWFEIHLLSISATLPLGSSVFFFGLVNFNVILLLLLLFLIFRNVVKLFVEQRGKVFGRSLKSKLVTAFVGFSTIPTLILFLISIIYVNGSFEKWFSFKMIGILKSSIEVTQAYYFDAKKKNYHFADLVAKEVGFEKNPDHIRKRLKLAQQRYALDLVEYYSDLKKDPIVITERNESNTAMPKVSREFLEKGLIQKVEASQIHPFGDGNLVRVIVPAGRGAVVVSSVVPLSLISKMNDVSETYDEFRDINPLEYPLKSIYVIILCLMTFVILFAAIWFGFHLAKQLSVPLERLSEATQKVARGTYLPLTIHTGSEEIQSLVDSFNRMTTDLEKSIQDLDRYSRYIEVVLKSVSAGVISVDQTGVITTINSRAESLLRIFSESFIGRPLAELFSSEQFLPVVKMFTALETHRAEYVQKEFSLRFGDDIVPFQMSLSVLKNAQREELGRILVFDDMTTIINAQRANAWSEVAQRIAHEIKNPLTPIKLAAERLERKFKYQITDSAFFDSTRMIIEQADYLKKMVNEFNQFARLPEIQPTFGNINETIEQVARMYGETHPQIRLVRELAVDLPHFKFDPDQIRRALINLIDNAIAAVEEAPRKEIALSTVFYPDLKIIRVTMTDTGCGMEKSELPRIFEPYFSKKINGTGLGLAIVKKIVEDHNGFIRTQGNDPTGLKFILEFPVYQSGVA